MFLLPNILKIFKIKMGFNEKVEGIELMRALENGFNVGTFIAKNSGFAVDVNQDLMRAISVMPKNKIRKNINKLMADIGIIQLKLMQAKIFK